MNILDQVAEWPTDETGETDFDGIIRFVAEHLSELTPEMSACAERLRERFDDIEALVVRMVEEEGIPPDHLVVQALVYTLGTLNMQTCEIVWRCAEAEKQKVARKPPSEWLG